MGQSKLKVYAETEYGVNMTLKKKRQSLESGFFKRIQGAVRQWHEHLKHTVYDTSKANNPHNEGS